jgi:hypothetical protein
VECTGDYLVLLFLIELNKVYGIAGNTYGKLRILLGMLLSINKCVPVKYVYIKVMATLFSIAVK